MPLHKFYIKSDLSVRALIEINIAIELNDVSRSSDSSGGGARKMSHIEIRAKASPAPYATLSKGQVAI